MSLEAQNFGITTWFIYLDGNICNTAANKWEQFPK